MEWSEWYVSTKKSSHSLPVSLWLFGAHVGVRRLLGDKDTANLAQLLVHLKGVSRIVIDA